MREARLTALAVLLAGLTDLALVPAARGGPAFIAIGIAVLLSLVAIPRVRRLFRPPNISVRLLPDGVPLVARPARCGGSSP